MAFLWALVCANALSLPNGLLAALTYVEKDQLIYTAAERQARLEYLQAQITQYLPSACWLFSARICQKNFCFILF